MHVLGSQIIERKNWEMVLKYYSSVESLVEV